MSIANVATSQLATGLVAVGGFVVTPAILRGLGDSAYGGWLLMNSMIGYMRLLDQGTSQGTLKYGSGALAREDHAEVARVFDSSAAMFLVAGAIALLGGGILSLLLPRWYPSILGGDSWPIFLLAMGSAIDLFLRVYGAGLRTRFMFFVIDGTEILTYSIFKLGLVLWFSSRLTYHSLALIMLAETLTRNLVVMSASAYFCPYVRHLRPHRAEKRILKLMVMIGASLSIIMIADLVRFQLDAAVIGYFMPQDPAAISKFGLGTRLPAVGFSAIGVIGPVMVGRFSGLAERGEEAGVLELLRSSTLVVGLMSVFFAVNCAVLGPSFLAIWLKKPWVGESARVLVMMLPAYVVWIIGSPASGLLVGRNKLRGQTIITCVEAAGNLVCSVALVHWYGIVGVALGTIIPMMVVRGVLFPLVLQKELGITAGAYWRLQYRALGLGALYLVLVGGIAWLPITTYARFFGLGLASAAVFAILVLVGVPEARAFVLSKLRKPAVTTP